MLMYPFKPISGLEKNAITFEQTNQMIKLSEGIKLKDTDNTYIIINTKFVKPYLKSPVLLEAYVTVLNEKEELSIKNKAQLKKRIEKEIEIS